MISARNIARSLKSSTQPVYSAYSSMEELKNDLYEEARTFAGNFLTQSKTEEETEPFLSIGMQYLRFAYQERELFRLLNENAHRLNLDDPFTIPGLIDRMRLDRHLTDLDESALKRLLSNMSIYTHGLASMIHSANIWPDESALRGRLFFVGGMMIYHELSAGGCDLKSFKEFNRMNPAEKSGKEK